MADDPKIIKKLSEDLDALDFTINDITEHIKGKLNKSLAITSENIKELFTGFEKGEDITKKLENNLRRAKIENRNLGLEQKNLNNKLNDALIKLNQQYTSTNKAAVTRYRNQIRDNQLQQELNEEILKYLGYLGQVNENEKRSIEEKKKQNSLTNFLKKKLDEINLTYLSTLGIITFIIKAGLKANEQTTQLGKTLGLSYENANNVRQEMVAYSRAAEDSFINTDRLVKAQTDLTEQLGFAVKFSNQELETFSRLTEIVGLTAQEAGSIAKFSAAVGMTSKDYVSNLRVGAFYAQQSTKTHFSDKQILQDISKLSTGILIKFQGNPKALAQAVVQAKALGTSLEQVDKVGESLLNWESSIENELKAELITGKQLNLEKARYAALTGDQVTLMNELANQVGSLTDYQNMNVIAQKSLAEAFGMSRDEMSEMLIKQEAINKYGSEASKLNKEQLEYMEKHNMSAAEMLEKVDNQRSAQERFNDAIGKLQDIIGNIVAGPLGEFLKIIGDILSNTVALSALMGGVLAANLAKLIVGLTKAGKISRATAITDIIGAAWKSLGPLPVVGAALAGAAIAGGIAYLNSQKVEDGIAPPNKGPFTITDSYGATAITAKGDGIAVSPNINKGGGSTDLTPMISAINEVRNAINELKNRPSIAYINGKDAFASNLGTVNALGTSQIQNSYKLA